VSKKPRKPYTMTSRAKSQRQSACLTRRRKTLDKDGEIKEVGDKGKLKALDNLTQCSNCEAQMVCTVKKLRDEFELSLTDSGITIVEGLLSGGVWKGRRLIDVFQEKEGLKCPLFMTFRNSVCDVLSNPVMYLAKKIGELDVQIRKQQLLDSNALKPLSRETLRAVDMSMKAVKLVKDVQKSLDSDVRGVKVMPGVITDNDVIDVDFDKLIEGRGVVRGEKDETM